MTFPRRHPELVSGSIGSRASVLVGQWMLKQVQHDVERGRAA